MHLVHHNARCTASGIVVGARHGDWSLHDPFQVVGKYIQVHLDAYPVKLSGQKVRRTHPLLERPDGMFIIEGIPSLIMAVVVVTLLVDKIDNAKWLTTAEKNMLKNNLDRDNTTKASSLRAVIFNGRVWLLVLILLTFNTGFYGLAFWMPTIIKATGISNTLHIGLLTAIPYATAIVAMTLNAWHSNKTGERRFHASIPAFIGGIGLICSAIFAHNLPVSIFFLSVSASGLLSLMPIFWTLPGTVLSGVAAAAGIGMINAFGNLSGFTGSMITATAETLTGDMNNGTYVLGGCLLISCELILLIPKAMLSKDIKA